MKFVGYKSLCVTAFHQNDQDILSTALVFNTASNVTGFLHLSTLHDFQYIEGPAQTIEDLTNRFAADTRQVEFCILDSSPTQQRQSAGCSMGKSSLSQDPNAGELPPASSTEEVIRFLQREALRQNETSKTPPA